MSDTMQETQTTPCLRCGVPLRVIGPGNPEARFFKLAQEPGGICASCAATAFLQDNEMLPPNVPLMALLSPHIQESFAAVMQAGNADARPAEINWQRVVDNWALPFPKRPRKKRSKRA